MANNRDNVYSMWNNTILHSMEVVKNERWYSYSKNKASYRINR